MSLLFVIGSVTPSPIRPSCPSVGRLVGWFGSQLQFNVVRALKK